MLILSVCLLLVLCIVWIVNHRRQVEFEKKMDYLQSSLENGYPLDPEKVCAILNNEPVADGKSASTKSRKLYTAWLCVFIAIVFITVFLLMSFDVLPDSSPSYAPVRYIVSGILLSIGIVRILTARRCE